MGDNGTENSRNSVRAAKQRISGTAAEGRPDVVAPNGSRFGADTTVTGDESQSTLKQAVSSISFLIVYTVTSVIISLSQFPALLLYPIAPRWYRAYIRKTEELFGLLLVFVTEFWVPATDLVITAEESVTGLLVADPKCACGWRLQMPSRAVLIANHQIYADWIYIWCYAYFANAHGALKIILKDSLKYVPFFGWGMHFFDFIFLSRKWEEDRGKISAALGRATGEETKNEPMWLLIFPEGTVVSQNTRTRSREWAEKMNVKDHQHLLLPRITGLVFCLQKLRTTVPYLYDITIGYDGLEPVPTDIPEMYLDSTFPHEIYTLRGMYLRKKYPRHIHMHVRRWATSQLPTDEKEFSAWLRQRWEEKDALMDAFYRDGRFPARLTAVGPASLPIKGSNYAPLVATWLGVWPSWSFARAFVGTLFRI